MTNINQHAVEDVKVSASVNSVQIEVEHARGRSLDIDVFSDKEPTKSGRAEMLKSIIDSTKDALEELKAEEE